MDGIRIAGPMGLSLDGPAAYLQALGRTSAQRQLLFEVCSRSPAVTTFCTRYAQLAAGRLTVLAGRAGELAVAAGGSRPPPDRRLGGDRFVAAEAVQRYACLSS